MDWKETISTIDREISALQDARAALLKASGVSDGAPIKHYGNMSPEGRRVISVRSKLRFAKDKNEKEQLKKELVEAKAAMAKVRVDRKAQKKS